jgi:hypothetical protein
MNYQKSNVRNRNGQESGTQFFNHANQYYNMDINIYYHTVIIFMSSNKNEKNLSNVTTHNNSETSDNVIQNMVIEDIDDAYAYGKYGDFKIIVMKKNGYINATKLCNDAGMNKEKAVKPFHHWFVNASTKELINYFATASGISPDTLFIKPRIKNELKGTYVHPD